jgi:hypothetical protein
VALPEFLEELALSSELTPSLQGATKWVSQTELMHAAKRAAAFTRPASKYGERVRVAKTNTATQADP